MAVIFQIAIIFFVGLIAYWWANQGVFSSILHFVAVVCAGAIALSVWEPLVVGVLLKNTYFDQYAWGMGLVFSFGIALMVIRFAFDRLAPGNVAVPHWANLVFGGVFGVCSGILTVGVLMIGVGFTQSTDVLLGVQGVSREGTSISSKEWIWVPAHTWTTRFYELLSVGSFSPDFSRKPLKQFNPGIDIQAFGLLRDTFDNGTSRVTLPPDALDVLETSYTDERVFVTFNVGIEAYDSASQFVLSSSQIRVLGYPNSNPKSDVSVGHPDRWTQIVENNERTLIFDDPGHFVTSVPGRQNATFQIEFPRDGREFHLEPGAIPLYLMVKGTRFKLDPQPQRGRGRGLNAGAEKVTVDGSAPMVPAGQVITVRSDVRPLEASINNIIGLEHEKRLLTEGQRVFQKAGRQRGNRQTRILGVFAPDGTVIIQVDASRRTLASLFGTPARQRAGDDAAPMLVDNHGNTYRAKGYMVNKPTQIEVSLTPSNLIDRVGDLPHLPTSDAWTLRLFFEVTSGVTIIGFKLGDETVCRANVLAQ